MFAAIILCSALLPSEGDGLTVRVVNTLEEPVSVRFRIVGREEWVKDELALDAAQTKNFTLPNGDKYEMVVRDDKKKDLPVGSWDLGKMLAIDAKAEIHIVESNVANTKRPAAVEVRAVTRTIIGKNGVVYEVFEGDTEAVPLADSTPISGPATDADKLAARSRVKLSIFSQKRYFPIDEFINGKSDVKPASDRPNAAPAPVLVPPPVGPVPTFAPSPSVLPIRAR